MSPLVTRTICTLATAPRGSGVRDALEDAAFLFEKARGLPPCGWSQAVIDAEVTDLDIQQLKQALVSFVQRGGFGAWALGKCSDPALKPVLLTILRRHVDGDAGELYQAMIALDNLGEDIFTGVTSMSSDNKVENRLLARAYLRRPPLRPNAGK